MTISPSTAATTPPSDGRTGPSAPPPRRPFATGVVMISAGAVWGLWLLGVPIAWDLVLPIGIILVGVLLLFDRRSSSGGLVWLGIALVVATTVVAGMTSLPAASLGDRSITITAPDELEESFSLGAGVLTIDLRSLELGDGEIATLEASVGAGELRVRLPEEPAVIGQARVGMGQVHDGDTSQGGIGVEVELGPRVDADDGTGTVELDLQVGMGQVTLRR